jgi:hypothetical protein
MLLALAAQASLPGYSSLADNRTSNLAVLCDLFSILAGRVKLGIVSRPRRLE